MPIPSIRCVSTISGACGFASIGCAVHRVAARRIAAIGPVEHAILEIELEIDRLRQAVEEHFDVGAVGGGLTLGDFDARAKDSALVSIVRAFLRPVDLLALGVDGDPNAPPGLVAPIRVAAARLDERFNLRAVEIRAHHAHPFAVAPVELAVLLIELDLLRRERAARRNDDPAILSVDDRRARWSRRSRLGLEPMLVQ